MPTEFARTDLLDFGIGMLMGLARAGHTTLDERRLVDVHKAFVAAFRVVETQLGTSTMRFWVTTDELHGTSPDVDAIFRYWLSSGYATKDAPGTIYRFQIPKRSADQKLETLAGGSDLYDKAVTAYFDYLNSPQAS